MKIKYLFKNEKAALFIAIALIVFGAAEVVTGLRREFFGIVTAEDSVGGICVSFGHIALD